MNIAPWGEPEFEPVLELEGKEITEISGTNRHCLAVSRDGKVYVKGINFFGSLGLEKEQGDAKEFTEITKLKNRRIILASAGYMHVYS